MTLMQECPATLPELARKEVEIEAPQEEVLRPRRWTTAEYYALSDAGFFDDERVELLDGAIWKLPAQKTPHFYSTDVAGDILPVTSCRRPLVAALSSAVMGRLPWKTAPNRTPMSSSFPVLSWTISRLIPFPPQYASLWKSPMRHYGKTESKSKTRMHGLVSPTTG